MLLYFLLLSLLPPSILGAAAPSPQPSPYDMAEEVETVTVIETIYETVTRTVVRELPTPPSVVVVEKQAIAAPAVDLDPKNEEDDLSFTVAPYENVEGSAETNFSLPHETEENLQPAAAAAVAAALPCDCPRCPIADTAAETTAAATGYDTAAEVATTTTTTTEATTAEAAATGYEVAAPAAAAPPAAEGVIGSSSPYSDGPAVVAGVVPGFDIKEISGNLRMCSCDEAAVCKDESAAAMDGCMKECDDHLQVYGNQTGSYLECFSQNSESITEAEACTFSEIKDYCSTNGETKFIERPNWKNLTGFKYTSDADKDIKKNFLWKRDERKYSHLQRFFHCSKHCMHRALHKCTSAKGCGIRMPRRSEFADLMRSCTKKNPKISSALLRTCQCLAWRRGVTDLRGSCVVIGNQYYVDRA